MRVYLDIFFLVNFGMNFVVLLAESFFQNRKISLKRLMAAGFLGAAMACLYIVSGIHRIVVLLVVCYAIVSFLLIRIAFGKTTIGSFARNVLFFYVIAFMLAGFLMQIREQFLFRFSSMGVLGGASAFLLVIRWVLPKWKRWQSDFSTYYRIRVSYQNKTVIGNALWDTGNRLRDPFTGEPVMLGERKLLCRLWNKKEEPVVRMLPFHTVGKDSGFLKMFQADYIEVKKENKWIRVEHPWIAICDQYLSSDGEYEMILHPELLQEKE